MRAHTRTRTYARTRTHARTHARTRAHTYQPLALADAGFWDHEWARHGTCARPLLGERAAFFNATLNLHEEYDLDVSNAQ